MSANLGTREIILRKEIIIMKLNLVHVKYKGKKSAGHETKENICRDIPRRTERKIKTPSMDKKVQNLLEVSQT